jgi:hypothetical protein
MITPRQLTDIARLASAEGVNPETLTRLRRIYPGVYFTSCLDDDINTVDPVLNGEDFNVYLVDGRQMCLHLTTDAQYATGVVLAAVFDS